MARQRTVSGSIPRGSNATPWQRGGFDAAGRGRGRTGVTDILTATARWLVGPLGLMISRFMLLKQLHENPVTNTRVVHHQTATNFPLKLLILLGGDNAGLKRQHPDHGFWH